MRLLISLSATLLLAWPALATSTPLDPLFARPELWTLKPDDLSKLPEAKQFRWTSAAKDSARAGEGDFQLFGIPVIESVIRFDGSKLTGITSNFYARGDAGGLSEDEFQALVANAIKAITDGTKAKYTVRGKDPTSAVHAEGLIWVTPAARYLLEYSFTKEVKTKKIPFRAEFVRLEITPPEKTVSLLASASSTTRAKFTGATHVKRDLVSGDVVIPDVPMVDQGQKGYCAVACTERVMRYYGLQVDENELAQVANTSSAGGTSPEAMFGAIKKLGARLRVRVRPVEPMEVPQILALQREYNSVAKKGSRAPLLPDMGHMIDVSAMYHAMDPTILQEARTKNKSELTRFEHEVESHVDAGFPLIWSVMLGLVPEKGVPQSGGGHMRLIIGYNQKTQEILYTDSWGAGHELKRMPAASAWTICTGLNVIEPL